GFYCAYYNTHEAWWYLRFVLPVAPALVVGGILAVGLIFGGSEAAVDQFVRGRGRTIPALGLALALANGVWLNHRLQILAVARAESTYPLASAWLRAHLPPDAVVAAMQMSGAAYYYTG